MSIARSFIIRGDYYAGREPWVYYRAGLLSGGGGYENCPVFRLCAFLHLWSFYGHFGLQEIYRRLPRTCDNFSEFNTANRPSQTQFMPQATFLAVVLLFDAFCFPRSRHLVQLHRTLVLSNGIFFRFGDLLYELPHKRFVLTKLVTGLGHTGDWSYVKIRFNTSRPVSFVRRGRGEKASICSKYVLIVRKAETRDGTSCCGNQNEETRT